MTRRKRVFIAIAYIATSFTVGAVLASWYWLDFAGRFVSAAEFTKTQANLVTLEAVLSHTRAGRSEEATKMLELLFDAELVSAAALHRDGYDLSSNAINAIKAEHTARKVSGYSPANPSVREAIQESFRLLAETPEARNAQQTAEPDAEKASGASR